MLQTLLLISFLILMIILILYLLQKSSIQKTNRSRPTPTAIIPTDRVPSKKPTTSSSFDPFSITLHSLQIEWDETATSFLQQHIESKSNFKALQLRFDQPYHFLLPHFHQLQKYQHPLRPDQKVSSNSFQRLIYQPYYGSNTEKLEGVVRFGQRCCGPSKVNDDLPFDVVNGGSTIGFAMEMISYYDQLTDGDNTGNIIPLSMNNQTSGVIRGFLGDGKRLLRVAEIEYIRPIPLGETYKFVCNQNESDQDRVEVLISDFQTGFRQTKYVNISGEMYYDGGDSDDDDEEEEEDGKYYRKNKEFMQQNDRFPKVFLNEAKKFEDDEEYEFIEITFHETNFPASPRKNRAGINFVLPKYFLASQDLPSLHGLTNLVAFKYGNFSPFFNASKGQLNVLLYFGDETSATKPGSKYVHQAAICTAVDSYAYICQAKSVPVNYSSFTKVLKLTFFAENGRLEKFEFCKFVLRFEKVKEVMGNRKSIYGNVNGVVCSFDEKIKFAEVKSTWTSIENKK